MRLHQEVAHDVALMVKKIVITPGYERDKYIHEVAEKLVRVSLLSDTIAWYRYIRGEEVY